ncbi:MAG: ABC transporter ATP-binding protein [Lachnospiraceae bacterium]|nr:ABC transporter ATP-binding protein [Lachnospiraceae bacterium]
MSPRRRFSGEPERKVKKGTFKRLISNILAHKIRLVLIGFGIITTTFVNIGVSLFIRVIIDDYITPMLAYEKDKVDYTPLLHAILTFAVILLIGAILSFIYRYMMVKLSNGILRDIREQMFSKMQHFPIRYFDTNKAGDIMSKYTNDLDTFRQVISQSLPETIKGILSFIMIIACMFTLSINLVLVVVFMCTIMFLFTRWTGDRSFKSYRATQKSISDLNTYVEEMVLGSKEVKVYCYEERNIETFSDKNDLWGEAVTRADTLSNMLMPCMNSLGNIMYVFIAFVGGFTLLNNIPNYTIFGTNVLTIGTITSFMTFTKTFTGLIAELSSQVPYIAQSLSGAERIFDLIDTEVEIDNGTYELEKLGDNNWNWKDSVSKKEVPLVGNIVLSNVNFSYEKGKQVLKDINVYADKGQKVALVGATGAGKTTITNLINRFYEVDSGDITYDGIEIKDIKKRDLRDSFAVVLQDVNLFTGTIMENIRYGKLSASDEECISAAKLVCADSFIEMLPDGYNTMITGDAGGLSQGQKQLISIARAAVANPPCLILDEATSSIDTRTEKLVEKGMTELMKGRTVFIIAHRLSTIRDADVIMVMQNGEIIERGDHKTLLEKKGHYYELYTGKVEIS